ncbi:hypothetical protein [Nitrososphaera viennensis]|uniref:Uncharacterized protein n=2 Tax=Nitrososphaera viennensis TaxID=1034015 RepID=A0A060HKC1_9ARCH|nr:hypothetical protein [Nitrososphaera viennensis]AIC15908.1 hypothetical protein NVIE_016550 [Nitrososphaera viennensis EN76]UVS67895.1 LNG1/LNG2 family protein [Nitrososphaera viennensis]
MATTFRTRPSNITIIEVTTLIEGAILIALGLSVAFASYYLSDMKTFVLGPIDPSIFHELRVM